MIIGQSAVRREMLKMPRSPAILQFLEFLPHDDTSSDDHDDDDRHQPKGMKFFLLLSVKCAMWEIQCQKNLKLKYHQRWSAGVCWLLYHENEKLWDFFFANSATCGWRRRHTKLLFAYLHTIPRPQHRIRDAIWVRKVKKLVDSLDSQKDWENLSTHHDEDWNFQFELCKNPFFSVRLLSHHSRDVLSFSSVHSYEI